MASRQRVLAGERLKEGHRSGHTWAHGQVVKFAGGGDDLQQALQLGLGGERGRQNVYGSVLDVVVGRDDAQVEGLYLILLLIHTHNLRSSEVLRDCSGHE